MSTQATLSESVGEQSGESTCENGHEYCCTLANIEVTDDGFEYTGQFPCFDCFMTACRNADSEVLV